MAKLTFLFLTAFLTTSLRAQPPAKLNPEQEKKLREAAEKAKALGGTVANPTLDDIQKYIDGTFGTLTQQLPQEKGPQSTPGTGWQKLTPTFNPRFLGGNISGGGSVVERNGTWQLLDTYAFPQFKIKAAEKDLKASRLGITPFYQTTGTDIWSDMEESGPFKLVTNRLEEIAPGQRRLSLLILGILKHKVKFFFTFDPVKRYRDFYLPTNVFADEGEPELKVRTVILYDRLFGPIIDATLWNQLDVQTQAGLLIHEAFRFLRMVHPASITEQQLQLLTTVYLSGLNGRSLHSEKVLGRPLLDSLKKPGWDNAHETAEGTRLRLYYRRVLEQMSHLRERIEKSPAKHKVASEILDLVPTPCRTLETHEKNEIDCAGLFLAKMTHWAHTKGLDSEAKELFEAMELRDGNSGMIWEIDGKPSALFPWFYTRLCAAVGIREEDFREITHPWILRAALNSSWPLSREDVADAEYFASLVKAYFEARVWEAPKP